MKRKITLNFGIIFILLAAPFSTAFASIGSSASYNLEIADITNSGATASSGSYSLSSGVVGDNFDGKSTSSSYNSCAGFVEEAYGD